MTRKKDAVSLSEEALEPFDKQKKSAHSKSYQHGKSAKRVQSDSKPAVGKNTATYWQDRLFKPVTRGLVSPHYTMQVAFKGRRMAFTTGTGNKDAASRIAAGIYNDLLALGVEATLAKHRPQKAAKGDKVATIGEWITAAQEVSAANDATFTAYARALRTIAGGIAELKKNKKRFGPKKGGSTKYREGIDSISLEILTPEALQKWRLAYVRRAKTPVREKSAKTSCNSTIRQARSLFAPKIVKFLDKVRLPEPAPFAGVEFYERQSAKYFSKIDARAIVAAANAQLADANPQAFLVFLLAIGAGLRPNEIDTLCWHQIDFQRSLIRVEATDKASLKTTDSRDEVDIDEKTATLLQGLRARSKAKDQDYVIVADGGEGKRKWGQHYRADIPFNALIKWLRNYEESGKKPLEKIQKPIYELRKELGSLLTDEHGVYIASRTLRHSTVATTAAHYVDKKTRKTVAIGDWLSPENVIPLPEPAPAPEPFTKKKVIK